VLRRATVAATTCLLLVLGACGSDDGGTAPTTTAAPDATTTTTTAAPAEPLTVLVTNDDGIGAPGIDALVNALLAVDGLEVVVVAPAENQSGTSDTTTPGGVPHADAATASGVAGTAVSGFPADAVNVALDDLGIEPDLVVSGINAGQNVGPLVAVSGTVGAARTAARRGIPALAVSAGVGELADYATGAELVVEWIADHRAELEGGTASADNVISFNIPTCTAGTIKADLLEVPVASAIPEGVSPFTSDCTIDPPTPPADDVAALVAGYAAESQLALDAP
jgi:5'-nucleotidase